LGAIHGPEPITTNTGLGSVFLSGTDAAKLTERERFRLVKDLPVADHLSLFMVSRADGDVAATCIVYAKLGSIHIYIAKNETALEDEHHMLRLMGLCSGDVRQRYKDFPAFAYKAFEFITPFCNGKIRKRMKSIDKAVLEDLTEALERNTPQELTQWDEALTSGKRIDPRVILKALGCGRMLLDSGDQDVVVWASNNRVSLGAIVLMRLRFISKELAANEDLLSGTAEANKRLLLLSGTCDKLFRSAIFQKLLDAMEYNLEAKAKLKMDLGKLGAYHQGLELLYKTLVQPCQEGSAPLKIHCRLLRSPPKFSIKLAGKNWYGLLQDFWRTTKHGEELPLSKDIIVKNWVKVKAGLDEGTPEDGFHVPEATTAALHCELRLLEFLENNGIHHGFVGVSKSCCELCSLAIGHMNKFLSGKWMATSGHGRIYVGLLPRNPDLAAALRKEVDSMLKDELETLVRKTESPVIRSHSREIDPLEMLGEPAIHLFF
jgi:hypothetical protein